MRRAGSKPCTAWVIGWKLISHRFSQMKHRWGNDWKPLMPVQKVSREERDIYLCFICAHLWLNWILQKRDNWPGQFLTF